MGFILRGNLTGRLVLILTILLVHIVIKEVSSKGISYDKEDAKLYVNEFVLEFTTDNETFIEEFGREHGFSYEGKLFANYHTFSHSRIKKRSILTAHESHHDAFKNSPFVSW